MDVVRGAQQPTHTEEQPPTDPVRAALGALTELASVVDLSGEAETLLTSVAQHTLATTGAIAAGVALLEDGRFVFGGFAGDPALEPALSYPADEGTLATAALGAGRMLRLDPDRALPPMDPDRDPPTTSAFSGRAVLIMPLVLRGTTLGLLGVADYGARGVRFPPEAERRLEACAAVASLVVATRDSQRDISLRRSISTIERDRARWALELQAGPLQMLAAMRMALGRLLRDPGLTEHRSMLTELEGMLGETVSEVRALLTDLHPAALDDLGLVPALDAIAQRVRDRDGLEVELDAHPPERRLTPEIEAAACSAVNVALSNVVLHANARKALVEAAVHADRLYVAVCDDGDGLAVETLGFGESLLALRERLALVGGELELGEQPGGGVRLRAEIPVAWRAQEGKPLLS